MVTRPARGVAAFGVSARYPVEAPPERPPKTRIPCSNSYKEFSPRNCPLSSTSRVARSAASALPSRARVARKAPALVAPKRARSVTGCMPGTKTSEKSWETRSRSANKAQTYENRQDRAPAPLQPSEMRGLKGEADRASSFDNPTKHNRAEPLGPTRCAAPIYLQTPQVPAGFGAPKMLAGRRFSTFSLRLSA